MCFVVFWMLVLGVETNAQISLSGDARVRARFDVKDYGNYGNTTRNIYYNYRARINLDANIGDGWFFNTMLATNGVAFWTGKFGEGSKPSTVSMNNAGRGSVDFVFLYLGMKRDKWGFEVGAIPLYSLDNPLLDIHFYPELMVDIPFYIYSNMGAHGLHLYRNWKNKDNQINLYLLADDNLGSYEEDFNGHTVNNTHDKYSFMLDFSYLLGSLTIEPVAAYSVADDSIIAPLTAGFNTNYKLSGSTSLFSSMAYSFQSNSGIDSYSAYLLRGGFEQKAGPGKLKLWADYAKSEFDKKTNASFTYFWASYAVVMYSGANGSVFVRPTYRFANNTVKAERNYSRHKIEFIINVAFK